MIKLHLKNPLKLLIILFVILLNNIKIKGCLCCVADRCKVVVLSDNSTDLPKDDSKYKKIIEFIKDPKNHKKEHVETYHNVLLYIPLNIDINIEITEEEIKNIIDKEIDNIKNRTINVKKKKEDDKEKKDDKGKEDDKEKEDKHNKKGTNNKKSNKLGNLKILYIIENDEIIPVKAGTFHFEYYYDTKNKYNSYLKTYIDLWYDKYLKKEVYSFDNLKKFWNENNPNYLYCDDYNYPIFLFEKKNENNKQLFEKEKKRKHCSGFS